jgi:hypothetical protein
VKLLFGSKDRDPMLNKVGVNLANYEAVRGASAESQAGLAELQSNFSTPG